MKTNNSILQIYQLDHISEIKNKYYLTLSIINILLARVEYIYIYIHAIMTNPVKSYNSLLSLKIFFIQFSYRQRSASLLFFRRHKY